MRRTRADTTRIEAALGWRATTPLRVGLEAQGIPQIIQPGTFDNEIGTETARVIRAKRRINAAEHDLGFRGQPAQVFDDGAHVYVKLPDEARHSEAPVLFILEADGSKTLLNYNVVGDTYVTDRLFDRAVLISGVDGKEQKVLIERQDGVRR